MAIDLAKVRWMWNCAEDPEKETQWRGYTEAESAKIEEAFQLNQPYNFVQVENGYAIDFIRFIQFKVSDTLRIRQIQRGTEDDLEQE